MKILTTIKNIRQEKGYSHEYMALEMNLSQVAYTKMENGTTKLTVERLYKIAEILEVEVGELLSIKVTNQFNQTNKENATAYLQKTAIFHQENKEVYEKLIQAKDEQIALLKKIAQSPL